MDSVGFPGTATQALKQPFPRPAGRRQAGEIDGTREHPPEPAGQDPARATGAPEQPSPLPILAVRTGPAPVETPQSRVDALLRDGLTERATLAKVGQVIAVDRPEDDPSETELVLMGNGKQAGDGPGQLAGEGSRDDRVGPRPSGRVAPNGAGRLVSTPPPVGRREDSTRAEQHAEVRQEQQRTVDHEVRQESSEQASEVASNTGAVQSSDSRGDAQSQSTEPARSAVAEAAFTQAGVVEAKRADEIVTRFIAGIPAQDPGPEPHAKETLGDRSVPPSRFA